MAHGAPRHVAPIDYAVVEFPRGTVDFTGELARELSALVDAELIRLVDVLVVDRCGDGSLRLRRTHRLGGIELPPAADRPVLHDDQLGRIVSDVEPGLTFGVVVYENTWAAHIGGAARDMGGRVVASGRISAGVGSWEPSDA